MTLQTDACRSCGASLMTVLRLGETPLANALLSRTAIGDPEPHFPLTLALCTGCSLVQITHTVPPGELFENYLYFSSFSDTMVRNAEHLVDRLVRARGLDGHSLAVEIASNDGYLLQFYQRRGIEVIGIEPAANVAAVAIAERHIPTLIEFFGRDVATRLAAESRHADVIHANNVLAHVPDLNGFVEGIRILLKPDGVAMIEAPYLRDMIDKLEFDTIYHEHLSYFSLWSLRTLFERHGLVIVDVERLAIHGGSLRVSVTHDGEPSTAVTTLLDEEDRAGLRQVGYYADFASRVDALSNELVRTLRDYKNEGLRIAAYGASAKGSTLLNVCGIGADLIDFVVDRSTVKQGLYTPGTHLPVLSPEALTEQQPDIVLLLTWNFTEEILEQQKEYRARGGRFLIPVPAPHLV